MKTFKCYALEPLEVFDFVKIHIDKTIEDAASCKKCKKGKPNGVSINKVIEYNPETPYDDTPTVGSRICVLQQGTIPHREELNYRLDDLLYFKNGEITTEKTIYKVGKVIPQGIYIDFLS